ncbi:MAG: carboxypeptidase-like regulatory domain-containing protein, partial [Planctomycetota bacterium]
GVVVDVEPGENGARTPVPGVKVAGQRGFFGDADLPAVVTDEHGRFRIELADSGKRPLTLQLWSDPGERHRNGNATVKLKEGEFDALDLVVERFPTGDLVGSTVGPDGDAVPHVRLVLVENGEPKHALTSDDRGSFRVEDLRWFDSVKAERAGYVLLQAKQPKQREKGGWDDMRVVLAPVGRLRVSVRDPADHPVAGALVLATVSSIERHARQRLEMGDTSRAMSEATTDSSGVAELVAVWAGQRLEISIRPEELIRSIASIDATRHDHGQLVFGDTRDARPIVVGAGEELALRAVVPATVRVAGRLEDDAGKPLAHALVAIYPLEGTATRTAWCNTRTDDTGRFTLAFPSRAARVRARLTATSAEAFGPPQPDTRYAVRSLELAVGENPELVVVLPAPLVIAGRVLDRDGNGVRGTVFAYENTEPPQDGRARLVATKKDGTFVLPMLVAGSYDVRAQADARLAARWVRGVEAGRHGLEIRLDEERVARVTIEVALRGGEADEIVLLRRRFDPRAKEPADVARLPEVAVIADPVGWPRDVVTLWSGGGGDYSLTPMKENPLTILLDEGCYWLGAKARDKVGRMYFPIGTGLVRIGAGEHELRFELTPAVRVEGRVHASSALDLAVAIAWREGELLALDSGHGDLDTVRELGAEGYFAFELVPVGEHELRVGTPEELRAGGARHRQKITVKREGMAPLDVRVNG